MTQASTKESAEDGKFYCVMELLDGETLEQIVARSVVRVIRT